jgi:hypothetical protein
VDPARRTQTRVLHVKECSSCVNIPTVLCAQMDKGKGEKRKERDQSPAPKAERLGAQSAVKAARSASAATPGAAVGASASSKPSATPASSKKHDKKHADGKQGGEQQQQSSSPSSVMDFTLKAVGSDPQKPNKLSKGKSTNKGTAEEKSGGSSNKGDGASGSSPITQQVKVHSSFTCARLFLGEP